MRRALLLLALLILSDPAAQAARPNIIFILCDDLGYGDIGVFFQNLRAKANNRAEPWHFTPKLDAFAAQGLQLPDHYCPAPVCAPSRASLLLGVHQGHANVRDNQFDKALEDNHTLGTVLQQAGYRTACIGKWGLQGVGGTSPETWPAYPLKRGFDYYFGYVRHNDGHEHYPKEGPYQKPKQVWDDRTEISAQLDKCFTTDLFTARAKKWIADQHVAKPEQPFFLYLAYDTPHATIELPTGPYPAGGGLHGGLQWTGTPGAMINTATGTVDSFLHPDYAQATYDHDHDPATPEIAWPNVDQRYATAVRRLDDAVGDLVETLRDLKIDDDTLVVFTTDNGVSAESYLTQPWVPSFFRSFGPFDGIKRDCWEGGIRVGALVRWPGGVPAGRVDHLPCSFQDWMPTFAELAGVPPPARADGVSLVPTLKALPGQKTPLVYIEYFEKGKTPNYPAFQADRRGQVRNQMQALRLGDYIGVRYNIKSHADPFEIYNVVADPGETKNLASTLTTMQQRMKDRVLQVRRPDSTAKRPYDDELVPSVTLHGTVPGVAWKGYDQKFPWVPDFSALPTRTGGASKMPSLSVLPSETDLGLLFTGYLVVPAGGRYTFYLQADTGAFLRVHDAQLIDADFGYTGGTERSGTIALQAGAHPFRLSYIRGAKGTPALSLEWSGPGVARQPIPESAFVQERPIPSGAEK